MKDLRLGIMWRWLAGSVLCIGAALSSNAVAEEYPVRPIKLIVPFAPGGLNDSVGRVLATHLGNRLGQTVVVENRAGAGGQIGVALAVKQPADGYTLVLGSVDSLAMGPALKKKMPYDPMNDLTAVAMVASSPLIVVTSARFPVKTVNELVERAKAHPGTISYGSAGVGTSLHLGVELLQNDTGTKMLHVPYQGGAPILQALISSQIDFALISPELAQRYMSSGQIKVVAQADTKRHPLLPSVPTAEEQGMKDMVLTPWLGVLGPAKLPAQIAERLDRAISEIARDEGFRNQLVQVGAQVDYKSASQFHAYIGSELARWSSIIRAAGIPPQD